MFRYHYFHPAEVEEETLILPGAFLLTGQCPYISSPGGSYDEYYMRTDNKRAAYRYLRVFLQVLGSKYGPNTGSPERAEKRWVLKSPFHCLWLNSLDHEFPDADFICM